MTWTFEGHQGWSLPVVDGGRAVVSSDSENRIVLDDGTIAPDSEPEGWRAYCSCGWRASATIERVRTPDSGDDEKEANKFCYEQWIDHARSATGLARVKQAADRYRLSKTELDAAVAHARTHGGASWAAIGDATGVTRQAAHERWRAATS